MTDVVPRIMQQTLAAHGMLAEGQRALVAVSGGADSMALLHLLHRAGLAGGVAHFDHQTRNGASAEDAVFVARAAEALGLPCFTESQPVGAMASARKESFEMVAREVRYAFLKDTAGANGFDIVATGHHADDQAETVLMRLLRGASPAGLAGIPPVREEDGIRFIRPLLDCTRADLVAWLATEGIAWREDASNVDPAYERNKIRHALIPLLQREYNPAIVDALNRLASLQRMDESLLERLDDGAWETCVYQPGHLARTPFRTLDTALQHRCMLRCIRDAGGQADFETTARAVGAVISGDAGIQIDLGNGRALYVAARHAVIAPLERARDAAEVHVPIPGVAQGFGYSIRARLLESLPEAPLPVHCHVGRQLFDGDTLGSSFTVRHRRPGDRFQPLGMAGTRKLKDIFNDLGLTPPERDAQLLVESLGGLVWIPGHTICAGVALTEHTKHIVELSLEPIESDADEIVDAFHRRRPNKNPDT